MARARITFDDRELRTNLRSFTRRLDRRVGEVLDSEAVDATAAMKARAPWSDETGLARAGLFAVTNRLGPGGYELVLSYSVYYGIYLETANSGKNAVIGPMLPVIGRKVLSDLSHIIDRMR